jgi:hypothetical protein
MLKRLFMNGEEETKESWITWFRRKPFHLIITILFFINIVLIAVNAGLWIIAAYQKLFVAADFTSFYTGFYMVRVGEGANLYDPALQSSYQQQFMGGLTFEGGVLLFPNPPFVAILFSPISLLPLESAFYLWSLIELGLLIWCLISLNRLFSYWDKRERILLITTILAFWPLTYTFLLGQFSLFLLIGWLQVYIAMRNSKLTAAGLWMVILSIKPHTLLIPGMMTLNKRYWRMAVTAAIAGVILFIFTSLIIGLKPWLQYIRSLQELGSSFGKLGVHPNTEFTIRGVLSNILGNARGELTNTISLIILLFGMIFVWYLWRKGEPQDSPKFVLYFAFTILLSVFLSLHLNPHDSLILVVPAALFYDYLRQNHHPKNAYSLLVLVSPIVFFMASFSSYNFLGVIRLPVIVIVILLSWMIKYLILEHRNHTKVEIAQTTPPDPI